MSQPGAEPALRPEALAAAHSASKAAVRRTPVFVSASLTEAIGGTIGLKAECLQRTGSFKLRGALNKLRQVEPRRGVVAGSAGNHAQSVAFAARHQGVACEVFMPAEAAISKLEAVRGFGAVVHQGGESVDECVEHARRRAGETGLAFVHPFDDLDVICGQAGVGIELAEQVEDLRRVVVPIGGGGLVGGVAAALSQLRPEVEVIGVQAELCAPVADARSGGTPAATTAGQTIADGIAIKRPGTLTMPLIERWVADVVSVSEEEIGAAMTVLLEGSKMVVEGAGAAALAALTSGAVEPAEEGTTVAILSGGNVDVGLLAAIAAHQETRAGRRARLFTRIPDRPGSLARLLAAVAEAKANLLAVEHVRDGVDLDVRHTGVTLTIETRSREHLESVLGDLRADGYALSSEQPYLPLTP